MRYIPSTAIFLVLTISVLTAASVTSLNMPGDLDPTFGNGGKLTDWSGKATGVAIQSDGKIVAVGAGADDYLIARHNADGTPDSTFGGGSGRVTTDLGQWDPALSVLIQPDGKIIVVGSVVTGSAGSFGPARYNSPDIQFGGGTGKVLTPTPDFCAEFSYGVDADVAIQPDGKILGSIAYADYDDNCLTDGIIFRYHSDGSADTLFGNNGTVFNSAPLWSVALQPTDGRIVAVGDYTVTGFNPNGSLDTTFGTSGVMSIAPYLAFSIAIQSDGKILAAGASSNGQPQSEFAILRFNTNGSLDTSFDSDGIVTTPIGSGDDYARSIVIQSDAKIAAAGITYNGTATDFALIRYTPDGALDNTFGGGDGITTVDFGGLDFANEVVLDNQGRAVAVGGTRFGAPTTSAFAIARFLLDSGPGTITVINTNDSGAGSLRQALVDATPGSTINFNPNVFSTRQTITLTSGQLVIDRNLTIQGPGANLLSISGNGSSRVFYIDNGVTATLEGITIRNGYASRNPFANGDGSGIFNSGSLTVSNSAVTGNTSDNGNSESRGGGIYNDSNGTLSVSNSIISGNYAWDGGGIFVEGESTEYGVTLTVNSSTVSGNTGNGISIQDSSITVNNSTISGNSGDGISLINSTLISETLTVNNSTVSGNGSPGIYCRSIGLFLVNSIVGNNTGGDLDGVYCSIETASHNLIGDAGSSGGIVNGVNGNIVGVNPLLGLLRNNGGPTMMHALSSGSPAINAGDNCVLSDNGCGYTHPALVTDQRGMPRNGAVDIGAFERQANDMTSSTPFDFDGDGKADPAVFRPSEGNWYMLGSQAGFMGVQWGLATDKPVPADYDADGKTDVAIFRDGVWWMLKSTGGYSATQWGLPGEKVVPADYDGDGKADQAIFRDGVWWILKSSGGYDVVQWGLPSDIPVPADYDGDGKADQAIFRDGVWWILKSSGGYDVVQWGLPTDKLIPADYDGDGKTDQAIFRDGEWWIVFGSGGYTVINWGLAGDTPVPADYDGDGKADPAVYRDGIWWTLYSNSHTTNTWGIPGDVPVSMRAQ